MKLSKSGVIILILFLINCNDLLGANILVDSQQSFNEALAVVQDNDTITWENGSYTNIYMNIQKSYLVIQAKQAGETKFTAASRLRVDGDHVTLTGFQFINGDIGTNDVIRSYGNYNLFSHINISDYISYKYLVIDENSQYNRVAFCNFENRLNLDDKNILSILVDPDKPGYHTIQYCSFKNFDGSGGDMGIEPIRIGLSTQSENISRSIVEYCYFTACNGDGEIISNKAEQNVFRYNTFEGNPKAELVLRHGDYGVVYGNFFLDGMGGIRIKEGQKHVIFNNYFNGLRSRPLILQNHSADPLDSIIIAFNTVVGCEALDLGANGSYKPQNINFANNIFSDPLDELIENSTGNESWTANIAHGALGINRPPGIDDKDPKFESNGVGFYQLSSTSPAIDAAQDAFHAFIEFAGIEYDNEILLDIMRNSRPHNIHEKDIGCLEYNQEVQLIPFVTEGNTGPSYLWDKEMLNLEIQIEGTGSVITDPPGPSYYPDMEIQLTAIPDENYFFKGWSGALESLSNPLNVIMDESMTIRAKFEMVNALSAIIGDLNVFPNPSANIVNLQSNELHPIKNIMLFDLLGTQMLTMEIPCLSFYTMDISAFPKGHYYLVIDSGIKIMKHLIKI